MAKQKSEFEQQDSILLQISSFNDAMSFFFFLFCYLLRILQYNSVVNWGERSRVSVSTQILNLTNLSVVFVHFIKFQR